MTRETARSSVGNCLFVRIPERSGCVGSSLIPLVSLCPLLAISGHKLPLMTCGGDQVFNEKPGVS